MGHASLHLEEGSSMLRDNDDRKDDFTHQSGVNTSTEKKSPLTTPNGSAEAGSPKQLSEVNAHSQDRAMVALTNFIDLAERQVSTEPATKRLKTSTLESGISNVDSSTKHVADIVLILAGLGLIRAGREPTDLERRLQAEAYGHLGFLVQKLAPSDLVSPDLLENLIEDLGFRKPEGQEVKTFSQILEGSRPPPSLQTDRVEHAQNGTDAAFSLTSQMTFDRRVMEEADSHRLLLSAPRTMLPAAKDEADQLQAELSKVNSQEGHWHEGQVSPSCSVTNVGQENLSAQKYDEVTGSHRQFTQAIQDLLQSRYPADCQFQAAHSRTFMSASMPCEICKMIVRETANVLVCDSCEKVFHLRCLQSYLLKGIPKGDWYCPKCIAGGENNQEQHQTPKYGRVKAGFSFAEGSVGALNAAVVSPAQGPARVDISQGTMSSANLASGNASKEAMTVRDGKKQRTAEEIDNLAHDSDKSSSEVANPVINGSAGGSFTALLDSFAQAQKQSRSSTLKGGQSLSHIPNQKPSHSQDQAGTRSVFSHSQVRQLPTVQFQRHSQSQFQGLKGGGGAGKIAGRDGQLKKSTELISPFPIVRVSNPSEQSKSTEAAESSDDTSRGLEQEDPNRLVKDTDRFGIEWIGDVVQKYDGKIFYTACSVGGFLYRLQDCALFRPETPNVPPYIARLQALWEDTNTGSKWVRVNWCYYPADMAMISGRPLNPEGHEVYESNHGDNNLVGTIQGPCLVLRPESYLKEMERRQELLKSGNTGGFMMRLEQPSDQQLRFHSVERTVTSSGNT